MSAIFKALSDPTHRQVLQQGPLGAGELAALFDVSKPTMSAHFAVLVAAGLIEPAKHGRTITYRLKLSVLEDALLVFAQTFGLQVTRPQAGQPAVKPQKETSCVLLSRWAVRYARRPPSSPRPACWPGSPLSISAPNCRTACWARCSGWSWCATAMPSRKCWPRAPACAARRPGLHPGVAAGRAALPARRRIKLIRRRHHVCHADGTEVHFSARTAATHARRRARVPGAINLGVDFDANSLPQDMTRALVFYCSNPLCLKAPGAARRAKKLGYTAVWVMSAGITGWNAAQLPVHSGNAAVLP